LAVTGSKNSRPGVEENQQSGSGTKSDLTVAHRSNLWRRRNPVAGNECARPQKEIWRQLLGSKNGLLLPKSRREDSPRPGGKTSRRKALAALSRRQDLAKRPRSETADRKPDFANSARAKKISSENTVRATKDQAEIEAPMLKQKMETGRADPQVVAHGTR
jgi:hypothetical protein